MEKKQKLTTEEALAQLYVSTYKFSHDNTFNIIKLYDVKYKMLKNKMIEHEEKEPLKFFKKTHKNWEIKKDKLNLELEITFNNLMEEYKELEELVNFTMNN